jgi:hypothetical protein
MPSTIVTETLTVWIEAMSHRMNVAIASVKLAGPDVEIPLISAFGILKFVVCDFVKIEF